MSRQFLRDSIDEVAPERARIDAAPDEPVTPVFVFSLPRSGSTLVQRILAVHPAVETAAEPWLLLPFFFSMLSWGVYAAYGQAKARLALEDFCKGLPGGVQDYMAEVRTLSLRLYRRHSSSRARYFVDKTPRYHVIAPQILETFPDAKCVFLWRNPLSIVASMIDTWGRGRWNAYEFEFDLFNGLERLSAAQDQAGGRAITVRYEDLIGGDEHTWRRLFSKLDLEFDPLHLTMFSEVPLEGRMGDKTGLRSYQTLSRAPVDKWKKTLASPLRKMWCRRYLEWIGEDRLRRMGYDLRELQRELDSAPTSLRTVPSDLARMIFGLAFRVFEPRMLRDKIQRVVRHERVYSHY